MIENAERSLAAAKELLFNRREDSQNPTSYVDMASSVGRVTEGGKIIEGIFDGTAMIGPDGKEFSIPANYASKSKLVAGDQMKLTIKDDGTFLYKQIGPVERTRLLGELVMDDGNYKVVAGGRALKVLYASVTYFKAKAGDKVTILVPESHETEWAAIENVLPIGAEIDTEPDQPRKEKRMKANALP